MKHSKKKRRRSKASMQAGNGDFTGESEEERIIKSLVQAFSLVSVEEVKIAYKEANGDPSKAANILSGLSDNLEGVQISCSSSNRSCSVLDSSSSERFTSSNQSSSVLDSSCSEGFTNSNDGSDDYIMRGFRGNRGKKVVAATGTISTVLGKDYVSCTPRKENVKFERWASCKVNIEEAEQFLCSMLGEDCELNLGVVRDVLRTCGFDVEKALEVLLDLSASPCEQSQSDKSCSFSASNGEDSRNTYFIDNFWQLSDRGSDSNSHSSESEVQDSMQFFDINGRNYVAALISSQSSGALAAANRRTEESTLPQQVLESLFNIPKSSEREPDTMNWRNVVKQMESFAQKRVELLPSGPAGPHVNTLVKGAEYQAHREAARQSWDKMKNCYQKAAVAYSNGEKNYASYMSDQGKAYSRMAREADEKASMEIFKARNKDIENVLTIDLHGQHVKPAMRLVKLHLLFGTYISSVQYLRIITGCGSHGLGKSKLKQSVIDLVERERIEWREENRGTLLIGLDGPREFSFLDSGSDSD